MKIKKRYYFLAAFFVLLYAACQSEFMKFRESEREQREHLQSGGQFDFFFGTYQAEGREMHYTHTGDTTLPLLLMVHGSPGSSADMLPYLGDSLLLQHFQMVSVDRPGFGFSSFGRTERSLRRQAAAIAPILERYRTDKAILMGYSYGGPLICRLAMDYPELTDGLVIVAGSINPALEPKYWWAQVLDWPILCHLLPPAFRVSNQEILSLPEELEAMLPLWGNIDCPVVVIQGTADGLVDPANADFARRMLVHADPLTIDTLAGESHFILWTRQEVIKKWILSF